MMALVKKHLMVLFSILLLPFNAVLAAENYSYLCTLDKNERKLGYKSK